ncbi:hypothetical protein ABZ656_12360 [Streptomyces sp. NPDC007095]
MLRRSKLPYESAAVVRAALPAVGGALDELVDVHDGIVTVRLGGACHG